MDGFKVLIDTIISPKEAFESLRERPTWAIALIVFIALFVIGFELQRPAAMHASIGTTQHMLATSPLFANMTADQKAKALDAAVHPPASAAITGPIFGIIFIVIGALVNALILWIAANAGGGSARFSSMWAASLCNAAMSIGLASVVLGIIAMIRGADSFAVSGDLVRAMPSLGTIVPIGGLVGGILSSLTLFALWGLFLNMQTLRFTAGMKGAAVWVVPAIITLLSVVLGGYFLNMAG